MASEFSSELAEDCLRMFFSTDTTGFNFDTLGSTSLFVALTSGQTGVDGSLSAELANANNYARVAVTFDSASIQGVSGQPGSAQIQNNGAVQFAAFTGSITGVDGFAICKSGTHGTSDVLCYGNITSIDIDPGDTVTFADNAITIKLD